MIIREYFYNEDIGMLYVEFSTDTDGDDYYRSLDFAYYDIEFYYPELLIDNDLNELNEESVIELINQYLEQNDLPPEQFL